MNQLNIFEEPHFDDTIIKKEFHTYIPFIKSFGNNDEIRITIQSQDIYTLPSESYIRLQGKLTSTDADAKLTNNAYAYMFDEIRFEINGVEIDRIRDVGNTSTIKALASLDSGQSKALAVAGWCPNEDKNPTLISNNFDVCIPLNILLGVAEFYNKVFINCKLELILIRSHGDNNCFIAKDGKVELNVVEWHVPHVGVSDELRLHLFKSLKANKPIRVAFHRWDLYEIPECRKTSSEKWAIRNKSQLEKPRYVLVAFQTDKRNKKDADASNYDHVRIRNLKLYLNDTYYPYDKQNYDFGLGKYSEAYYNYINFQRSYYGRKIFQPVLSYEQYKTNPIFVIDCSKQLESVVSTTVDIQLEYEGDTPLPDKTSLFCLIINDALVEYNPLTSLVTKII